MAAAGASPGSALAATKLREAAAALAEAEGFLRALGLPLEPQADPHDLFNDCWALGHVAAAVQATRRGAPPPAVPPARPAPGSRRFREVVEDFTAFSSVCRELGVPPGLLPPLADVEQGHGGPALCACLEDLAGKAAAAGLALPRWGGDGARGRSGLRASMSREASAKRAELFSARGSPPKLPALDKCMTPRAFAGRAPTPAAGAAAPRAAAASRLQGAGQQAVASSTLEQQEEPAPARGLQSTVEALERAAVEAAEAARQLQAVPQQRAAPRRPVLPPLNVAAAAALAAAEAAEESEEGSSDEEEAGEHAGAAAAAAGTAGSTPLASPASSLDSPHSSSYCTSRSTAPSAGYSPCSAASASPSRHKLTPTRLAQAATCNPLWAASPQASTPPPSQFVAGDRADVAAAAAAEATLRLDSESPPERQQRCPPAEQEAAVAAVAEHAAPAAPAAPAESAGQASRAAEPAPVRGSVGGGGGGDLLESLLCPPRLKPSHHGLLGALMHTYTPPVERTEQQQAQLQQTQPQERHEEEPVAAPAAAGSKPRAAAKPAGARAGGHGSKLGMLLFGAAAGAVAALAAGLAQQGGGHGARPRSRRPQASPRRRHASRRGAGAEREQRQAAQPVEAAPAAASWDHAAFTQG